MWDVFISHAWEDKESVARPLAEALTKAGLKVWYDEYTLTLGDSLRRSIDRGLAESRYGLVVLSPNFFAKEWPQRELDGLTARETSSGKVILPIWYQVTYADVLKFSSPLADKLGVSWGRGVDTVVQEILRVVKPEISSNTSIEIEDNKTQISPGIEEDVLRLIETARQNNAVELDLSNKGLHSLPLEIGTLNNLQRLNLSNNHLSSLPLDIANLINLRWLDVSGNQLISLPTEIGQLVNLQRLYLSRNRLMSLPSEIGKLTELEILRVSDNKLATLPVEVKHLTSLEELFLSRNRFKVLPIEIGQLISLNKLNLIRNYLTSLPGEIGQVTNLSELDMDHNRVNNLPAEIGQLINLTMLNLNNNELSNLPPEIGNLKSLVTLGLENNRLAIIPEVIGQLKSLTSLNLSKNKISIIPHEIGQLANLEVLYLNDNKIAFLPKEIDKLSKLKDLNLFGNQIPLPSTIIEDRSNPKYIISSCDQLGLLRSENQENYFETFKRWFFNHKYRAIIAIIVLVIVGVVSFLANLSEIIGFFDNYLLPGSTQDLFPSQTEQLFYPILTTVPEITGTELPVNDTQCPNAPPQRIGIGDIAMVCVTNVRLIAHELPGLGQDVSRLLASGDVVLIEDGPVCSDNSSWWKVGLNGVVFGWVREGGDEVDPYFLCPVESD